MDRVLADFITIARRAGVRISTSESIDAFEAVTRMGYHDREVLKDSLYAVLAKSQPEKEILGRCFDRFFSGEGLPGPGCREDTATDRPPGQAGTLADMLLRDDRIALLAAMRLAARQEQLDRFRLPTQRSLLTRRILESMGATALDVDIRSLQTGGTPSGQAQAAALEAARNDLVQEVRQFVTRQLDLQAGDLQGDRLEDRLRHAKLSQIEQDQFRLMHEIILRLTKKLNDHLSRRRRSARRGHLDFKRTLRDNVTYQGLLFNPKWKRKKIDRPDVVVLCDVSRSVMRTVRFLLLTLYSLNQSMVRIRSFIFCSNLVEVTDLFEKHPVAEALSRIQNGRDLPILLGRTDYDQTFREFHEHHFDAVSRRTTVIILGDARNNFGNPQTELLKRIYERCRRLVWLNPEIPPFWGTGDSEIKKYMPYCDVVRECNTLAHLERIVRTIVQVR